MQQRIIYSVKFTDRTRLRIYNKLWPSLRDSRFVTLKIDKTVFKGEAGGKAYIYISFFKNLRERIAVAVKKNFIRNICESIFPR